ncbi:MAG: hypothetical protein AABZ26_06775 [Chloroflexota bacterium]
MSPRAVFTLVAGSLLLVTFVLLVIRPAVERGGWGELALVAAAFGAILLFERWLRTR